MSTFTSSAETDSASVSPTAKKQRIILLDIMRGIALFGVLAMNIMGMAQPDHFYGSMDLSQPVTGANFYVWIFSMVFLHGSMRGMFSVLFGAGTMLLLNRLENSKGSSLAADIYYRRLLWMIGFGLINAFFFLWYGDILFFYGTMGLVLFPFRNMSARKLMIPILVILLFGLYRENASLNDDRDPIIKGQYAEQLQKQHKALSAEQKTQLEDFQSIQKKNSNEKVAKDAIEEVSLVKKANYSQLFDHNAKTSTFMESVFYYNAWWDILFMFFAGMAFYKSGFITGESPLWVYLVTAIAGLGIVWTLNYLKYTGIYNARFDYVKITASSSYTIDQFTRLLQVAGNLSLIVLLYKLKPFRYILNIFAAVGQMAFTNYLSQSILAAVIFFGFGLYGKFQRYEIFEIAAGIAVFQIIFSNIWMRYFTFGPFEWLWRSLTYLKAQPLKRSNS